MPPNSVHRELGRKEPYVIDVRDPPSPACMHPRLTVATGCSAQGPWVYVEALILAPALFFNTKLALRDDVGQHRRPTGLTLVRRRWAQHLGKASSPPTSSLFAPAPLVLPASNPQLWPRCRASSYAPCSSSMGRSPSSSICATRVGAPCSLPAQRPYGARLACCLHQHHPCHNPADLRGAVESSLQSINDMQSHPRCALCRIWPSLRGGFDAVLLPDR
jgi:hypothetical protein